MPTVHSKQRRANTNIIENQALVASRLRRWQDGDIGTGATLRIYCVCKNHKSW